ncbi:MAG: GNAT family N-acetyltransferase [Cypionkella sp.]
MAEFRLETARLVLRDWRDNDLDALAALGRDAQVMATLGPPMSRADSAELLQRLQAFAGELGHTFWALERKADGRVIGFTGIIRGRDAPIAGMLEIGWRLASDCWGAGYATEAAAAALDWAKADRPGEDVYAITAAINARSQAVMARLGMARLPKLDFDHPRVPGDSPLKPHVTYRIATG